MPELTTYADRYNVLIVCPDGQNSWYLDSPVKPTVRYETFMTAELLPFVDKRYRTQPDRQHRAITGLSMGGHGALFLAMRHRDLYGQAGSLSGGSGLFRKTGNCATCWAMLRPTLMSGQPIPSSPPPTPFRTANYGC